VRRTAAEVSRWLRELGHGWKAIQRALGTAARTLRSWIQQSREGTLRPRSRGRPPVRSSRERRQQLLDEIERVGPHVGAEPLAARNRDMPRREVASILARVREVKRRRGRPIWRLSWRSGDVWAIDHAEAPKPIEGGSKAILTVRDLGSGRTLMWGVVENVGGEETKRHLEELIAKHGAPLAIKMDSGSGLCGKVVAALLERYGIVMLKSPPRTPRYNGSVEASIQWLKKRTNHQANLRDASEEWTREDLRAARDESNEYARWKRRRRRNAIDENEADVVNDDERRKLLHEKIEEEYDKLLRERTSLQEGTVSKRIRDQLRRKATERALIECGSLEVRRDVIHPRIVTKRQAKIP